MCVCVYALNIKAQFSHVKTLCGRSHLTLASRERGLENSGVEKFVATGVFEKKKVKQSFNIHSVLLIRFSVRVNNFEEVYIFERAIKTEI